MASLHRFLVGCLGLGFALTSLGACAEPAPSSARPGELELWAPSGASYAVVGRFHLAGVEPGVPRRELDFDTATSSVRVALPPGAYVLTLHAGARLVCRGEDGAPRTGEMATQRLVSTWPQRIAITPGELTTARIGFGSAPAPSRSPVVLSEAPVPVDPCASLIADEGVEQALLTRGR
jgi:hypothetical protein